MTVLGGAGLHGAIGRSAWLLGLVDNVGAYMAWFTGSCMDVLHAGFLQHRQF